MELEQLGVNINDKEMLHAVFFFFSSTKVMESAKRLARVMKFKTDVHKINHLFDQMTATIDRNDLLLPQIVEVKELIMKGIAVHHAGLLPFLKEIVEVLFSHGDVHVLFATETSVIGINIQNKTIIFPSLQKFDGLKRRFLTPGEYTQISGRAGRRGKDKAGTVIVFLKHLLPTLKEIAEIAFGKPAALQSQFCMTHWMLLN